MGPNILRFPRVSGKTPRSTQSLYEQLFHYSKANNPLVNKYKGKLQSEEVLLRFSLKFFIIKSEFGQFVQLRKRLSDGTTKSLILYPSIYPIEIDTINVQ